MNIDQAKQLVKTLKADTESMIDSDMYSAEEIQESRQHIKEIEDEIATLDFKVYKILR